MIVGESGSGSAAEVPPSEALIVVCEMEVTILNRRSNPRAKISVPIRVRPTDAKYPEEIGATLNISRDGLYFVTQASHYLELYFRDMKVHVIRNVQPNDPANLEEIGYVVRVDGPKDGKWGIAIRIAPANKY
jgi:hypothetical protein